jgi:hypothetical protein
LIKISGFDAPASVLSVGFSQFFSLQVATRESAILVSFGFMWRNLGFAKNALAMSGQLCG